VVLIAVQDVSARVSMERRLAAGERLAAAGELAGKIAHELNNPLDGVLRYIGLARRVCGEEAEGYLEKAHVGLTRMAGVIHDLMDQASAWGSSARRQPMGRLLDEAIIAMNPRAQALGVSVVSDLADTAAADMPGNLFQVFCNVIKNALDAMPGGGLLNIRLRIEEGRYVVEFSDTGCGIAPDKAEEIFQPFYTTKPHGEGAGLGLAICREILSRAGGTITAAARGEGGTAVTVTVPIPKDAAAGQE
jgi:C4-dicarboxylate-specific signal transduction histidine kinase